MNSNLAIGAACLAAWLALPALVAQTAPPQPPQPPQPPSSGRAAGRMMARETPYLGIGVQDIDTERAKALKLNEVRGVEVTSVMPDSPAAKAGFKEGDVVLEFNSEKVQGGEQLTRLVHETPVGRQVKIGVWRNGVIETLTATVEARKEAMMGGQGWPMGNLNLPQIPPMPPMPPMPDMPRMLMIDRNGMLGIEGESLGQEAQLAEFFGVKDGVLVKSVIRNSAAEKAGIKAGDVIVRVGDTKVNSTREISGALRTLRQQKTFTVTVVRNKKEMPVSVTLQDTSGAVRAMLEEIEV
jgi:serine protease Do